MSQQLARKYMTQRLRRLQSSHRSKKRRVSNRLPPLNAEQKAYGKRFLTLPSTTTASSVVKELKFCDQDDSITLTENAWTAMAESYTWLTVAQGAGAGQRIGRKIYIKKMQLRCFFHPTAYDGTGYAVYPTHTLRLMLVLDTQNNSAASITVANVLDTATVNSPLTFNNLQNNQRFRVLWDKSRG